MPRHGKQPPFFGFGQWLTLTLTLSPGERGQQLGASSLLDCTRAVGRFRFAESLRAVLPLPGGEGRGEGNRWRSNPRHTSRARRRERSRFIEHHGVHLRERLEDVGVLEENFATR